MNEIKIETCMRCKKEFADINYNPDLPLARRVYCNNCLDIMLGVEEK